MKILPNSVPESTGAVHRRAVTPVTSGEEPSLPLSCTGIAQIGTPALFLRDLDGLYCLHAESAGARFPAPSYGALLPKARRVR